jgi:hypothetical protein
MGRERSFFDLLSLCLRSRCPVCEKGRLFLPLPKVRSVAELCLPPKNCDHCGFCFRREPGYYFGVLTPALPILSLLTALVFVIGDYLIFRPEDPHDLLPVAAAGTLFGLVFNIRNAIAIYISFDHALDPPASPEKL